MRQPDAINEDYQRRNIDQVARSVSKTVFYQGSFSPMLEGPMRIKNEGLHSADDVQHRHCNLVPQPERRHQQIDEIEHDI